MKISIKKGFSFGLTSGVITTLGLIVGLNSSTRSMVVVLGGIFVIAVADALSDAVGIHISEESELEHTTREIWETTIATLASKFVFALTFAVPILLFPLNLAIIINVLWGLFLITVVSIYLAKQQGLRPGDVVWEHLVIAVAVIIITHLIGSWVATLS